MRGSVRLRREAADLLACLASDIDECVFGTHSLPGAWSANARGLALEVASDVPYCGVLDWREMWAEAEAKLRGWK